MITKLLLSIFLLILLILLTVFFLVKVSAIKKSASFSLFSWLTLLVVVALYFQNSYGVLRDLSDIWLIAAYSYLFIYELNDWLVVKAS